MPRTAAPCRCLPNHWANARPVSTASGALMGPGRSRGPHRTLGDLEPSRPKPVAARHLDAQKLEGIMMLIVPGPNGRSALTILSQDMPPRPGADPRESETPNTVPAPLALFLIARQQQNGGRPPGEMQHHPNRLPQPKSGDPVPPGLHKGDVLLKVEPRRYGQYPESVCTATSMPGRNRGMVNGLKTATFGSRPLESQNGKTSRNDQCIPKPTKLNALTGP